MFSFKPTTDPAVINLHDLLLQHLKPKKIIHYERHKFFQTSQTAGTSIQQFVAKLRCGAATCEFGNLLEDLLLTQFIQGLGNVKLQKKLLIQEKLTFDVAIQVSLLDEAAERSSSDGPTQSAAPSHILPFSTVNAVSLPRGQKKNVTNYTCYSCNKQGHIRANCHFKNCRV